MSHANETPADRYRRLAWQCRRGIKEVEVVLVPFFEQHFMNLSEEDQVRFEKLLEEQDVDLFEWVTTRTLPEQPDLNRMMKMVLFGVDA